MRRNQGGRHILIVTRLNHLLGSSVQTTVENQERWVGPYLLLSMSHHHRGTQQQSMIEGFFLKNRKNYNDFFLIFLLFTYQNAGKCFTQQHRRKRPKKQKTVEKTLFFSNLRSSTTALKNGDRPVKQHREVHFFKVTLQMIV